MIRKIRPDDRNGYIEMADAFYNSDAVSHPIPMEYHIRNFEEMIKSDLYLVGYIFEMNGETAGFCVTSKTYSPEAGGMCLWVEDLYVKPQFRSMGLGKELFERIEADYGEKLSRIRLEVDEDNHGAISLYERIGFKRLPYGQMVKDF